ncbi:MAG: hypothetical protein AAB421_03825 [Patescibacteria group bacterium]
MAYITPYLWHIAVGMGGLAILGMLYVAYRVGFKAALAGIGWAWLLLLIVYPFVLYGIGAAMPSLSGKVVGLLAFPDSVKGGAMLIGGIGTAFIVVEILIAQLATKASHMVLDAFTAVLWGVGFGIFAGIEYGKGDLQYYEYISALVAIAGGLIGSISYTVSAWNKNPMQTERGKS